MIHAKKISCLFLLVLSLWMVTPLVLADKKIPNLSTCQTLKDCLDSLNPLAAARSDGSIPPEAADVSAQLLRFGEPAKQELLARAAGRNNRGWASYADSLLGEWRGAWTVEDIPKLRQALQNQPGHAVARVLGKIGTPEAIKILVEDLSPFNFESQTGYALTEIVGDKVLPYLLPLLSDDKNYFSAVSVIRAVRATEYAPEWIALALDDKRDTKERVGALRGLGAVKDLPEKQVKRLLPLLDNPNAAVKKLAEETLTTFGEETVLNTVAASCHPNQSEFDQYPTDSCIQKIVNFAPSSKERVASILLKFLSSKNPHTLYEAITGLGLIQYRAAIPAIEGQLNTSDFRVFYAAVRSLSWLKSTGSVDKIRNASARVWLPALKAYSDDAVKLLLAGEHLPLPSSQTYGFSAPNEYRAAFFFWPDTLKSNPPTCSAQTWTWLGKTFSKPKNTPLRLEFKAGILTGIDKGEWGGALEWQPKNTQEKTVIREFNVVGLAQSSQGAIVASGLNHMMARGDLARFERGPSGQYQLAKIAEVLDAPSALATIGDDLFVAWSAGWPIVFDRTEIKGIATCNQD